jgi:hypothetical protein
MEPKHSGLGIASTVLSVLIGIAIFALVVIAGVLHTTTPGGLTETSPAAIIVGLGIIGGIILDIVALGLGIAGLTQQNRQKIFPILGTLFSSLTLLGTIGLIVLGNMVKQ